MSLLKNTALRGGTDLNPDERVYTQYEVRSIAIAGFRTVSQSIDRTALLTHCTARLLALQLNNMPVTDSRVFIYPRLFALHNLLPDAGLPLSEDPAVVGQPEKATAGPSRIVLPAVINLSIERLQCDGVFLLEDSMTLYMWVGRSAPSALLMSLFGLPTMDGVDCKQVRLAVHVTVVVFGRKKSILATR